MRRAAKVDDNQAGIVAALRQIPGVTVEVGHDDIIVGYRGRSYWYEIKRPEMVSKGAVRQSSLKASQKRLLQDWTGHYKVVWNIDQILTEIRGQHETTD